MQTIRRILQLAALLVLSIPFAVAADQTDERLDELFQTLRHSQDDAELIEVEASIWEIWYQSGIAEIDVKMVEAGDLVRAGQLQDSPYRLHFFSRCLVKETR